MGVRAEPAAGRARWAGAVTAAAAASTDRIPLDLLVQQMVAQVQSFPLIAIPFFMLTGALMMGGCLGQAAGLFRREEQGHESVFEDERESVGFGGADPENVGLREQGAQADGLLGVKGGEAADRWANLGILAGMTYTIRPRDWPKDLVIAATKPGERSFDAVSGAFLMTPKAVFEEVRGFDEKFFMYGEDLDWAKRITDCGWEVWYNPQVTVLHIKEAASRHSYRARVAFYKALTIFYEKHYKATTPFYLDWLIRGGVYFFGGLDLFMRRLRGQYRAVTRTQG